MKCSTFTAMCQHVCCTCYIKHWLVWKYIFTMLEPVCAIFYSMNHTLQRVWKLVWYTLHINKVKFTFHIYFWYDNDHNTQCQLIILTQTFPSSIYIPDIDECDLGVHGCHEYADCDNEIGSYRCTCRSGYHGDGHTCLGRFYCYCHNIVSTVNFFKDTVPYPTILLRSWCHFMMHQLWYQCNDLIYSLCLFQTLMNVRPVYRVLANRTKSA